MKGNGNATNDERGESSAALHISPSERPSAAAATLSPLTARSEPARSIGKPSNPQWEAPNFEPGGRRPGVIQVNGTCLAWLAPATNDTRRWRVLCE